MADQETVRRIALSLPETGEYEGRFAFFVLDRGKRKAFAWVWMERLEPKKPRVAQPGTAAATAMPASFRKLRRAINDSGTPRCPCR